MEKRNFNNRLLTVLIALTVIVCVVLVAVIAFDKDVSDTEKPGKTVTDAAQDEARDENPAERDEKELPENSADETSAEEDEVPDEKEQPEKEEPEKEEPVEKSDEADWNLILANPWNKIPEDFTVELTEIGGGHKVDSRIVSDLNSMMSDLRSAGHSAFVCSSYRTNNHQTNLYNNEVNDYRNRGYSDEDAAVEAAKWVAIPGTSEHQTGLAVDIMSSYYLVLDRGQEDTAEQKWLMANSYKYGFILRYPNDKSEITGIYYEPWHYRYVGKEAAKEIFDRGICFEEYLLG